MKWKSSSLDFCFYVLILASAVVFVIGVFNGASLNYKQKHCTQDIRAEIVRIEKDTQTSGRVRTTVYTPYFTYSADGKIFTGHAKHTTTYGKYKVSDIIKIKINPENPKKYLVENDIVHYRSSCKTGKDFGIITLILVVCTIGKKLL